MSAQEHLLSDPGRIAGLSGIAEVRYEAGAAQIDAIAAHWDALRNQELALPSSHREAPIGPHDAMPRNIVNAGRKNMPDEARRGAVDVSIRADKTDGYGAHPANDSLGACRGQPR